MASTRYERGRDTEYKAQRDLEAMGYTTQRAPQSKGSWDVLAWTPDIIRAIQCKCYIDTPGSLAKPIRELLAMPPMPNMLKEIWTRRSGQRGWGKRILIWHSPSITTVSLAQIGYWEPDADDQPANPGLALPTQQLLMLSET